MLQGDMEVSYIPSAFSYSKFQFRCKIEELEHIMCHLFRSQSTFLTYTKCQLPSVHIESTFSINPGQEKPHMYHWPLNVSKAKPLAIMFCECIPTHMWCDQAKSV